MSGFRIIILLLILIFLSYAIWLRMVADRYASRGGSERDKKIHKLVSEKSTDKYMLIGAVGMLLVLMQDLARH